MVSDKKLKLTGKQERFALALFQGMSNRDAWKEAGYSMRATLSAIDVAASRVANNAKVLLKIAELQKAAEDASVATVIERKKIATQGMRGELKETEVIQHPDGTKTIRIKTAPRVPYITELNKMEGIYSDGARINFTVIKSKPLAEYTDDELDAIIEGRYKLLPEGDNDALSDA